jgi:DNA replication protein DnaC
VRADLPGDPNCPHCGGLGYLRLDLPLGHPDFGKIQTCICRRPQVSQQVHRRLFALSNLDELSHLTFENFQPRGRIGLRPLQADSLERAYNHARQFSQTLNGWLFIQGPFGCGKTHLAAAIANFAVSLGVPTLFLTVPDLLDSLRFSWEDPDATYEQRFDEIRRSPLLVMDDFGTQNATLWAQEKLFQILNYRYVNRLATVVTTNQDLVQIEPRIRSRMLDPELVTRVEILASDYRRPTDDTGDSELSSLNRHRDQTFSSFEDRRGEGLSAQDLQTLDKAEKAAMDFARDSEGWLVFVGPHSCGKTHLAAAIANFRADMGHSPLFVYVPDLLDHLRATFNPQSTVRYDHVFDEVKQARLLILDGLGTQSSTPWAREKLFQLFDYRYNAKLPTVITMSEEFEALNKSEPGLASRMLDRRLCTIYAITVSGYHGGELKQFRIRKRPRG